MHAWITMAVMSSVRVSYCSHNLYASTTSATAASCGSPNAATCMQKLGLGMVRVHLKKHCKYCSSLHRHGQRFIHWMYAALTRSTTSWLDMNSNTPSLANTTNAVAGPRCRVITSGSATTPSRSAAVAACQPNVNAAHFDRAEGQYNQAANFNVACMPLSRLATLRPLHL